MARNPVPELTAEQRELGISPRRRVGGLGPMQRERLGAWLAAMKG